MGCQTVLRFCHGSRQSSPFVTTTVWLCTLTVERCKGGPKYAAERRESAGKTSCAPIYRGDCQAEGQGGPGYLEHPRPSEGVAGVHARLQVAQSGRVLRGTRGD